MRNAIGRGSLRARMTLGFVTFGALFSLAACSGFYAWARYQALADAEERTLSAAQHLVTEWKDRTPAETFGEVHEDARLDAVAMILVDRTGRLIGSDGHPALTWPLPRSGWIVHRLEGEGGTVAAGMAWDPVHREVRGHTATLAGFALLTTLVAGVAAWAIVGRTLRPIGRLADGADAASSNSFRARLVSPSEDAEITHLVATLNGLLERLRDDAREREQFYASAAHELRTPLAVLSAGIEVALSRTRTPDEHIETLEDLRAQTARLVSLAEGLLTLNRIEMRTTAEASEPIDLSDLVERTLAHVAPLIKERDLRVETDHGRSREIEGPPNDASILVRNAIENAVRHATAGGHIGIVTSGATLRVENDYPPDAPLDLERIFLPFVQGDASRSGHGNGLGLTLARRVAEANGWSFVLSRRGGTVRAEVGLEPALDATLAL